MSGAQERLEQITRELEAIQPGWPFFLSLLQERIEALTAQLVHRNDEETRGRIKALRELERLPVTLQQERDGIAAGLADEAPAN